MAYKELKKAFRNEKNNIKEQISNHESLIKRCRKIINIVDKATETDGEIATNVERLSQLKKYFPDLLDDINRFDKFGSYKWILFNSAFEDFNSLALLKDAKDIQKLYDFPTDSMIEELEKDSLVIEKVKMLGKRPDRLPTTEEELMELARINSIKIAEMGMVIDKIHMFLANRILKIVHDRLNKVNEERIIEEIEQSKEKLKLIEKYNLMFSDDKLLEKFESDEDFKLFIDLIKTMLSAELYEEVIESILIDQSKEEKEEIKLSFDNLDMSMFDIEEKNIIDELREIIEDEKLDSTILTSETSTFSEILSIYQNSPIIEVLSDVKNSLINKIYDSKKEVIELFKVVIDKYQKYVVQSLRENQIKELLRIENDFKNIIIFINRTYMNKEVAHQEKMAIEEYIKSIDEDYVPTIQELINIKYDDQEGYYDNMFDVVIMKYKGIIKKWKKEMTSYYEEDNLDDDVKEDTDNLVFCLTDDIDLSEDGHDKEFIGTIESLESKSSIELKKGSGRKGMTRIRKTTDSNKEKDYVEYLATKKRIKVHFTPYRFSSIPNCRTGLIKFEPSTKVKEFLEKRYGLSKQSAYYGVFGIITTIKADHSEYSYFEEYIYNNYLKIEEIAKLFASDNPDFEKLTSIIDELLEIKKNIIKSLNQTSQK